MPYRSVLLTTARSYAFGSLLALAAASVSPAAAWSQVVIFDNTDPARPLRVEDAFALPRYALDLYLVPTWQGAVPSGSAAWRVRPGLSYGLVPRTQIDITVPMVLRGGAGDRATVAGVRLAAQYNLNLERRALPAVALDASMLIPTGSVANAHPAVKGLATKTFRWGRLSANSEATFGDEPTGSETRGDLTRWQTGLAVDRAFVRRAFLVGAELVAEQPLDPSLAVRWNAAVGGRLQLTPTIALDGAVSRGLTESADAWGISAAVSRVVSMPTLIPGVGRWGRR